MAAQISNQENQNLITGKVILKETGVGIPDLVVVIYDLDPGAKPEESFQEPAGTATVNLPNTQSIPGDRIGSVLTNKDGSWSIIYNDAEFRISTPTEKRPDLLLAVMAPEDADADKPPIALFSSKLLRANSGRIESYMIRLSLKQLTEFGIPVPAAEPDNDDIDKKVQAYRSKRLAEKTLREKIRGVNLEFAPEEAEQKKQLRQAIRDVILPDNAVLSALDNFVKPEVETIEDVQKRIRKKGADQVDLLIGSAGSSPVPGEGIKISLVLTDQEKNDLAAYKFQYDGRDYYNIPEDKIEQLLFKRETDNGVSSILFSDNPVSKFCIQKTSDDKCAEAHTGISSGDTTTPPSTPPVADPAGISKDDIPFYLEKILADKTSNQFQSGVDYKSQRPDSKSVQEKVDSFSLEKGPADTTAFYDFHSLQIAFDHVWHQLLDETVVNLGDKIQTDLENAGKKGLLQNIQDRVSGLKSKSSHLIVAVAEDIRFYTQTEVPVDIAAAFDISFLEYDALSADNKTKLAALAKQINQYETEITGREGNQSMWNQIFNSLTTGPVDHATLASVLRDQGERIIDNVRINKPNSTNQLLKELQDRLLSKYEFTVFAADRNYHSVNFGLMNTYRQKWEPICYQAGKLVKTIPLSPKEERKYSIKTTLNSKITRKQAQKYNSSLQQEVNTTSRAESEIVARANDKSNFNMSVKLDYSKITSELTYGKNAEKDSSQTKKDFREAVLKAAQEFKEERSLDVDTEETTGSEYNESGMVVNPNDELSVTYLFYELQRRYRISEQLYRVMPVVLVAQEVPSPDQITEGWIIANDWILNRALLDDSYRNALQYLAQKNVGDDFAIRELRKNLRQQRTLVNNLQVEFSKLQKDAENKYQAMENAVQYRIEQEHIKRTYRWWWWWGQPNRPDSPPDPEMAKALEQAATDEQKYAAEKAEKMSLSLQREVNALHQLTKDYNDVMQEHLDRITQVRRLITHIKENILYYMQAIWSMEPPDQRFMRLYKVNIPAFEATRTCIVADDPAKDIFAQFRAEGKVKHDAWLHGKLNRNADGSPEISYKQLVEVADLDTLVGFKGNYMIFPLKEHNALTRLMAAPYVDEAFGAMDPDQLSNINLEEYSKYICYLHDTRPDEYERLKPVLKEWLQQLLADPLRNGDEVIIPTGSLFIEMLPSDKSLLEDFKLKHREWDVFKAQAEVRKLELENLRYAARLLNAETDDPDIDKKIVFNGEGGSAIVTDNS